MCQVKPKITVIVALAVVISGQFSPLPCVVVPSRDVFQSTLLLCARLRSTSESGYNYYYVRSSRKERKMEPVVDLVSFPSSFNFYFFNVYVIMCTMLLRLRTGFMFLTFDVFISATTTTGKLSCANSELWCETWGKKMTQMTRSSSSSRVLCYLIFNPTTLHLTPNPTRHSHTPPPSLSPRDTHSDLQ